MRRAAFYLALFLVFLSQATALAKVDLVILPKRDSTQLTIYNAADLTLVREKRVLTLKKGLNRLQFSWANTLIDPTSLDMLPGANAGEIDVLDLSYPPGVRNLGLWHVSSPSGGKLPVEITYLTSGLSWRAFYIGTLSKDEKTLRLDGYVRVTNQSGENYEKSQVRMIVGRINLIDRIVDLAGRENPYGRPGPLPGPLGEKKARPAAMAEAKGELLRIDKAMAARPKEIKKEGLSEYFLYTIEGRETVPHGWSKRLPSFTALDIPVVNLYRFEQERYGNQVMRFLRFKNDKDHKLGRTPIPGGTLKVFRDEGEGGLFTYEGASRFKYIPVDQDIDLNLGPVSDVLLKVTLMDEKTEHYRFDKKGAIEGWDEIKTFQVEAKNTRETPVRVEVTRNVGTTPWELEKTGNFGDYEKVDLDTVKFTLNLKAGEKRSFSYTWSTHHGRRAD